MLMNEARIKACMEALELDVLVATTPENVLYVSGYRSLSHWILKGTQVYAILARDQVQNPCIITPMGDTDMAGDLELITADIIPYAVFYMEEGAAVSESDRRLLQIRSRKDVPATGLQALIQTLKERDLAQGKIGLDEGNLTPGIFAEIKSNLHDAEITEAYGLLQEIRMIKTDEEIERLRRSARIVEKAIDTAFTLVKDKMTEEELAREFWGVIIEEGGLPLFTAMGFGARSAYPNVDPSPKKLQKGEVIRFDVGCSYKGYSSDIARTGIFGTPTEKQAKYYEAILKGEERGIKELQPGMKASEVFEIVVNTVRATGIPHYKRHHVGHGIGIELYDPPLIAPTNEMVLEEGMVLNIETPYYEIGFGGLQVEDTIVIRKDGAEFLTAGSRELRTIG